MESAKKSARYWCIVDADRAVMIPPELLAELGVPEGDVIAIDAVEGGMVLRKNDLVGG